MKAVITILGTFIVTCILIYGGCRLTNHHILNCKSCEQFNIDNFELRTFTDIKNAKDVWCNYDEKTGAKTVKFFMNITQEEFQNYLSWNGFNKADSHLAFKIIPEWNDSIHTLKHSLYYKQGRYNDDTWRMILDSNTNILWAELVEEK